MNTKIVYLDCYTLNPGDLSWDTLLELGQVELYEETSKDLVLERSKDAEIILTNKIAFDATLMDQLPQLKCIVVTATGYNIIDVAAAKERGIVVCNVVGYSTPAVVQHVFAMLFALTNQVEYYDQTVRKGDWANQTQFSYWHQPLEEVWGQTMGIYGFGRIGQGVARVALALGMKVLATHKHPKRDAMEGVNFVDLESLFSQSDVISLHAPLTKQNTGIVNNHLLHKMKPSAYLINTGRGGLINEQDLKGALQAGRLKGAGLDVLTQEPPPKDHPLIGLKHCLITPHQAWASKAARSRLLEMVVENIKAYQVGQPISVVS